MIKNINNSRYSYFQSQYLFLYEALLDSLKCPSKAIPKLEFSKYYQELDVEKGVYYNETMVEQQYKVTIVH